MYRTVFWTLWEKARVGCFKRTASKHVYYLGWNRSPAQVGCMRQALGPGALRKRRGRGWRGSWEGGSEWGTHVNPWLIDFNVWQNSLQIKKKKNWKKNKSSCPLLTTPFVLPRVRVPGQERRLLKTMQLAIGEFITDSSQGLPPSSRVWGRKGPEPQFSQVLIMYNY